MPTSQKQKSANKKNASKGGVKTAAGKEISKYNALKHGLRAKEIVLPGIEDPAEFDALQQDLTEEFKPVGIAEKIQVKKMAEAHWRRQRAPRYEAALNCRALQQAAEKIYDDIDLQGNPVNSCEKALAEEIAAANKAIQDRQQDQKDLARLYKEGRPLQDIYHWGENWSLLLQEVEDLLGAKQAVIMFEPSQLKKLLIEELGWSETQIWQRLINLCPEQLRLHSQQLPLLQAELKREKEHNANQLQLLKQLTAVPAKEELDRLQRYERFFDRQYDKALHELQRLQYLRRTAPLPLSVDAEVLPHKEDKKGK